MTIVPSLLQSKSPNHKYPLSSHLQVGELEKKQSLPTGTENNKVLKEDENGKTRESEVCLEQAENISNECIINNAKTILPEEFNNILLVR